ncbi:MAG: flagellar biosynthetic protein FliO [Planctomycetota bacterium]
MLRLFLAAALVSLGPGVAAAQTGIEPPAGSFVSPDGMGNSPGTALTAPAGRSPLKIGGGGVRLGETDDGSRESRGSSVWGMLGALALVLGLFAAGAKWLSRSRLAAGTPTTGACEALAKVKLEPRAAMHVVKVGSRIVLVGSAADGLTALGQIDDPVEAEALAAAGRVSKPNPFARRREVPAARESFRTLFGRAAAEPPVPVMTPPPQPAPERVKPELTDAERRLAERLRPVGAAS